MEPSKPTFKPTTFNFENEDYKEIKLTSSDGKLEKESLYTIELYINGIKFVDGEVPQNVKGKFIYFAAGPAGDIIFYSSLENDPLEYVPITESFEITKVVYEGVTYYPE